MISLIVCSVKHPVFVNFSESVKQTIGVDFEIIKIDNGQNKYSLAEAYNLGAKQAKYPYLCFVHEDILFKTEGWGANLINHFTNSDIALIGILGCVIKTKAPSGVYIAVNKFNRINQLQRTRHNTTEHYYQNPHNETLSEVKILDGMFLATTKSNHEVYNFDEKLLKGFHAYDLDYSLGQAANGKVVVVYDILMEHFSYGGNTIAWVQNQLKVTKKWDKILPQHNGLTEREVLAVEIKNTETFLNTLYILNYNKSLQLKYLIHLLAIAPLNSRLLYFLRRFLIYGEFEKIIKKSLPIK